MQFRLSFHNSVKLYFLNISSNSKAPTGFIQNTCPTEIIPQNYLIITTEIKVTSIIDTHNLDKGAITKEGEGEYI